MNCSWPHLSFQVEAGDLQHPAGASLEQSCFENSKDLQRSLGKAQVPVLLEDAPRSFLGGAWCRSCRFGLHSLLLHFSPCLYHCFVWMGLDSGRDVVLHSTLLTPQHQKVAWHATQQKRALKWGAAQRIQLRIFRHHLWRRRTRDKVAARYALNWWCVCLHGAHVLHCDMSMGCRQVQRHGNQNPSHLAHVPDAERVRAPVQAVDSLSYHHSARLSRHAGANNVVAESQSCCAPIHGSLGFTGVVAWLRSYSCCATGPQNLSPSVV